MELITFWVRGLRQINCQPYFALFWHDVCYLSPVHFVLTTLLSRSLHKFLAFPGLPSPTIWLQAQSYCFTWHTNRQCWLTGGMSPGISCLPGCTCYHLSWLIFNQHQGNTSHLNSAWVKSTSLQKPSQKIKARRRSQLSFIISIFYYLLYKVNFIPVVSISK